MKRKHVHLAFATGTAMFAALTAYHTVQMQNARRVNDAIHRTQTLAVDDAIPEARFAHAVLLAEAGDYDTAATAYKRIVRDERSDLRRAARYNLGNLHLREALKAGTENATHWLPLIELAKQSYRDLLREDPYDWEARHNLERALQLAPEVEDSGIEEHGPPPDSERTTSTISGARMELP